MSIGIWFITRPNAADGFRVRKSLQADKVLGEAGANRIATLYNTLFPFERPLPDIPFRFVSPRFPSINYFESEIVTINPRNEDPRRVIIPSSQRLMTGVIISFGEGIQMLATYRLLNTTVNHNYK